MPVGFILDFRDGSPETYDTVVERMQLGGRLPQGALFHVAGPGPSGGLRVVDVWESDDAFQSFADAEITPRSAEAGLGAPQIQRFDVAKIRDSGMRRDAMRFFHTAVLPLDRAEFESLQAELFGGAAPSMPEGLVFHANGPLADGGWIVAAGWTSRAARDRFLAESVGPAMRSRGKSLPVIEEFDVHNTLEPAGAAGLAREDILRVLDEQDAAFNRHDAAAIASTYADDAVMHDQSVGDEPMRGRRAVQQFIDAYMQACPDLRWERVGVEVDGAVGVEQWRASGTHDGDLPGLPATHRRMSIEGCSVMHFGNDGLVHEEENYWDEAAMLRQLGAMQPVAAG